MEFIIAILFGSHLILLGIMVLVTKDAIVSSKRYHRERIDHAHTRAKLLILSPPLDPPH
jgi:hypothetical protein